MDDMSDGKMVSVNFISTLAYYPLAHYRSVAQPG